MNKVTNQFKNRLNEATGAYIFVHTCPDFDCVSSAVAMSYALGKLGKKSVIMTDDIKKTRKWFDKSYSVISDGDEAMGIVDVNDFTEDLESVSDKVLASSVIRDYEFLGKDPVLLFCDCKPGRAGKFADQIPYSSISDYFVSGNVLVIDHHPAEGQECETYLIDENMSSASEMCAYVIRDVLNVPFDKIVSQFLFMGIASDSGFFQYAEASNAADTFALSAELVRSGAVPNMSYAAINYGREANHNLYLAELLKNVRYDKERKIALVLDDLGLYFDCGPGNRPADVLFEVLRSTRNVDVVIFIKYGYEEGRIDCSVRTGAYSDFDAGEFCRKFEEGGGHKRAASFRVYGEFDDVVDKVIELTGFEGVPKKLKKCS